MVKWINKNQKKIFFLILTYAFQSTRGKTQEHATHMEKKKRKTRVVEDFRTPLSITCGTASPKISKDIQDLNNTIKQINLPCIRTLPNNG